MSMRWNRRLLPLELLLSRRTSFLRRIPLLWRFHRKVTGRLVLLDNAHGAAPAFRLDFMTPYLHAIQHNDLMVLIVSLSEIGTGNSAVYAGAVENLWQWVSFHCGHRKPESAMLVLLRYVRDWGPLGMTPLYGGLIEILTRLRVAGKEQILFDFYADHCGVRDNKNGRLLAVRTLDTLKTDASRAALRQILAYVTHRGIEPEELTLIKAMVGFHMNP